MAPAGRHQGLLDTLKSAFRNKRPVQIQVTREMIGLQRPSAGRVLVLGEDLAALAPEQALALRLRWGVMFQRGGLFGALTA